MTAATNTFDIHGELLRLQEHDLSFENEIFVADYGNRELDLKLDGFIHLLHSDPSNIVDLELFDAFQSFIKYFTDLKVPLINKFVDTLISNFDDAIEQALDYVKQGQVNAEDLKQPLEMYAFLLHWLISVAEQKWKDCKKAKDVSMATATGKGRGKGKAKASQQNIDDEWDWMSQKQKALDIWQRLLSLDLKRMIISSPERDTLISMITKSIYLIMDEPENMKKDGLKGIIFEILALCVVNYDDILGVRTRVMQNIREDHLAEPMADFLVMLSKVYQNNELVAAVLRELPQKDINEKNTKMAKSVAKFLVRLSDESSKDMLKQMVHLKFFFDSESHTIRSAMVEVVGNLIQELLRNGDPTTAPRQVKKFYSLLEERYRDTSFYVRAKVMQIFCKLAEARGAGGITYLPLHTRMNITKLTVGRLRDKTSHVRKNAVKLLTKIVETCPYLIIPADNQKLSKSLFEYRLHGLHEIYKTKYPDEYALFANESEDAENTKAEEEEEDDDDETVQNSDDEGEQHKEDGNAEEEAVPGDKMDKDEDGVAPSETAAPAAEPPQPDKQQNDVKETEIQHIEKLIKYYDDGLRFIIQVSLAVPTLCELLFSTTKAEVLDAITFFVVAHQFGMECAEAGIAKMVHKIWDKDTGGNDDGSGGPTDKAHGGGSGTSIRDHIIWAYTEIYMNPITPPDKPEMAEEIIVNNLIGLTNTMTLAELTSLEQLLSVMMAQSKIPPDVVEILWATFAAKKKDVTPSRRRGALVILSMFAKSRRNVIEEKLELLVRVGLGELGKEDLLLARYTCIALQQLANVKRAKGVPTPTYQRFPVTHPIFKRILAVILESGCNPAWFGFAEQAVNAVYALAEHPDVLCGEVIRRLTTKIFGDRSSATPGPGANKDDTDIDSCVDAFSKALNIGDNAGPTDRKRESSGFNADDSQDGDGSGKNSENNSKMDSCRAFDLSKLCFAVGHVALKQIVHLEIIETEWKRRRALEDTRGPAVPKTPKTPRRKSTAATAAGSAEKTGDELEQVVGCTAEDEFTEAIAIIRERELLYGKDSLLTVYGPLVAHICRNNTHFSDPMLQTIASLALCKLMCVSSEFCDSNLQLLFTILERSTQPIIRSNIIIALGDMTVSFNSLIDANISYLYKRLNDPDSHVKKNTLMVLTHLILNGMVKVKGQISELAKCLVVGGNRKSGKNSSEEGGDEEDGEVDSAKATDEDEENESSSKGVQTRKEEEERIQSLAKMFFAELSSKDSASVYNNLPDIISNLSAADAGVDEEDFQKIMRFLFKFITKEKQSENIVEKLCLRFRNSTDHRHWRYIGFCLSLLNYSTEKSVKKLMEGLPHYQDKLAEPTLKKYLDSCISKAKKLPKSEVKVLIEEFESKLAELTEKCLEHEDIAAGASKAQQQQQKKVKNEPNPNAEVKKERLADDGNEDEEDDEGSVDDMAANEEEDGAEPVKAAKPKKKVRIVEEEDDDEEEEEEDGVEDSEDEIQARGKGRRQAKAVASIGRKSAQNEEDEDEEVEDEDDVDDVADEMAALSLKNRRRRGYEREIDGSADDDDDEEEEDEDEEEEPVVSKRGGRSQQSAKQKPKQQTRKPLLESNRRGVMSDDDDDSDEEEQEEEEDEEEEENSAGRRKASVRAAKGRGSRSVAKPTTPRAVGGRRGMVEQENQSPPRSAARKASTAKSTTKAGATTPTTRGRVSSTVSSARKATTTRRNK
ncbi:Condensin complex subunit [Quaeritorhiza haematococci]|nr:Condensin complex subunit [Quaeritorhiza haematococci]